MRGREPNTQQRHIDHVDLLRQARQHIIVHIGRDIFVSAAHHCQPATAHQFLRALPCGQVAQVVAAHHKIELRRGLLSADYLDGIGGIMRAGPVDIHARNAEVPIARYRQFQHRQTLPQRAAHSALLDGMVSDWHKQNAVQVQCFAAVFSQNQMTQLRRIETAAQYADPRLTHSDHSSSKSPMKTVSPLRTPAFSKASTTPSAASVFWKRETASS